MNTSGQPGCSLNSAAGICPFIYFIMNAIIHCKANIFMTDAVNHPYITVIDNIKDYGEVDLIVEDIPYEIVDGVYQDPDEQLCEFYGVDYNLVNCIEAA